MIQADSSKTGELTLHFTNGDVEKFNEVMVKYNFVDAQALIRFAVSIMLMAEDNVIKIKQDGTIFNVEPADHSIKKEEK